MEAVQGRPRLSRRGREALLLGAAWVAARDAVGADHRAYRRAVPSRQSRRGPRAFVVQPQTHDRARAYAIEPSTLCRLDTGTYPAAGDRDRAIDVDTHREHPERA